LIFGRDDFSRDRTLDDIADLLGDIGDLAARFEDQRRIGGNAVEQSQIVQLTDILDVGGVDKKFHGGSPEDSYVHAMHIRGRPLI
jgi:hypothetical protein